MRLFRKHAPPLASHREDPAPAIRWVKSSLSFASGDCVLVAALPDGMIGVCDSKDPGGPVLKFAQSEWRAFCGGVRRCEFDHPGGTQ